MSYPKKLLAHDERIDLELRPHWKALIFPALNFIVVTGVAVFAYAATHGSTQKVVGIAAGVVWLVEVFWISLRPWIIWLNKNYVVTNRRLIIREGFISRHGRDMPLSKINDVSFNHNGLLERMLGCGTLVVESAGEHGQENLQDIPHVESVQRELTNLIGGGAPTNGVEEADSEAESETDKKHQK
jgi:uncharacterized membrane protein YdbT with pleckstrin-like domain